MQHFAFAEGVFRSRIHLNTLFPNYEPYLLHIDYSFCALDTLSPNVSVSYLADYSLDRSVERVCLGHSSKSISKEKKQWQGLKGLLTL